MRRTASFETPKRELLVFYYKYRMRLVLAFLLPFLLSIGISFVPTPRYEADSTLVVRLGSEYVYQPEIGSTNSSSASPIPFDRDQIYKAEVAILSSYDLHQQVIESVGLDHMYPPGKPGLLHRIVQPLRGWALDMLNNMVDDDAAEPAASLRKILDTSDSAGNLSDEEKTRRRLAIAVQLFEHDLNISLGKESSVISLAFHHKDRDVAVTALNTLIDLYLEKRKQLYLDTRSTLAKEQAESIRKRASVAQAAVENFKREHQLYSLDAQRAQLLAQREDVRKQMMNVSNSGLDDKLADITRQLDALDALDRQFSMLQHDVQMTNDEYTLYTHKLDEAQAYDNLERDHAGSVRVIQPPAAPPEPKRLQRMIIVAGFMLSLVFTALVAAFTEFSRSGFLTPERMEHNLGLPILAALPLRRK
ncbi:MAG: hypothetical protein P4M15_00785 [Alphaproteobacteria bacterium]|nr:hypothetical protein [Alphaproteobacteria bacterium]